MEIARAIKLVSRYFLRLWICLSFGSPFSIASADVTGQAQLRNSQIKFLLSEAKAALRQDRLTLPPGNNAVGYAQRVLDLAPGHPEAEKILRDVVARYGRLSYSSLDRAEEARMREMDKARNYRERGTRVAEKYQITSAILANLEERLPEAPESRYGATDLPATPGTASQASLLDVARRYATFAEHAVHKGSIKDAHNYISTSRDILAHYHLAGTEPKNMFRHLASLEGQLRLIEAQVARQQRELSMVVFRKSLQNEIINAIFIPPAF